MPSRLDGTPTPQTSRVAAFIVSLQARTSLTIATEDERLTSREAESRLAVRERDWRKRKKKLDAAAAAIILQDYLDRRRSALTDLHHEKLALVLFSLVVAAGAGGGFSLQRASARRIAATRAPSSSSRFRGRRQPGDRRSPRRGGRRPRSLRRTGSRCG